MARTASPGEDGAGASARPLVDRLALPLQHPDFHFEYDCDLARLPERLAQRFVPTTFDAATREFVERCEGRRHGRLMSLLHATLGAFLSDFDVNGILGTFPMHLLGTEQWRTLLGSHSRGRLLDVGAGSGDVTSALAPLFDDVTTTETSFAMVRRAKARGFRSLALDLSVDPLPDERFEVISCLNVLDRSARPRTLLRRLRELLAPSGCLVVATPLPYDPFFYRGGATEPPLEKLDVRSERWEDALVELVFRELAPLGLEVAAFTRAPYLSSGDAKRALYVLDDAVLRCSAV